MTTHEPVRILIVGAGHLGVWLATQLDQQGYHVTVIAPHLLDLERLGNAFQGSTLLGDGTQTELLEQAQIQTAQVLIALTNHDTENLLICHIARTIYQVPLILCGLEDPELQEIFGGHGFTIITRIEIEIPHLLKLLGSPGESGAGSSHLP
jgi:trk system potassium uptake protein TrkA